MTSTRNILSKTLVRIFYKKHAGLLLFVFYIFFGVVNGNELVYYHLSLVRAVLDSPILLTIVIAIWLLYAGKAFFFIRSQLVKEEMNFLLLIENFTASKKRIELLIVQMLIMLPVLLYGIFIFGVAYNEDEGVQAVIIMYFLILLTAGPIFLTELILNRTQRKLEWLQWRWRFFERMELVYLRYIFGDLNFGLAISKAISLLLMFGLLTGFGIDHYDVRLPLLAILIAASTHSMIVFSVHEFEIHSMEFMKQVPVSFIKRVVPLACSYLFLLLPEFILLVRVYLHLKHLADLPMIILFGMLWLTTLHAIGYYSDTEKERFQFVIFAFVALCFFLLLYHLQWVMIAAFCVLIFLGMNRWYFRFERQFE